jgi:hypothetical protein
MSGVATDPAARSATAQRTELLVRIALLIGMIGLVKYVDLALRLGLANAPHFFLVAFVVPFFIGAVLLRSRPRVGAVMIAVPSALLVLFAVGSLLQGWDSSWNWGDALVLFVATPLALLAVGLATRVVRGH